MTSGDACYECAYCGRTAGDDLEVYCLLPHRGTEENVCYCICSECKERFKRDASVAGKSVKEYLPEQPLRRERPE